MSPQEMRPEPKRAEHRQKRRPEGRARTEESESLVQEAGDSGGVASVNLPQALQSCQRELEQVNKEAVSREGDLLRALAEMDNQRKRALGEVEKAHKFALAQFLPELLPVKDSLESGLTAGADPAVTPEALREGMRLTLEKLDAVLRRFGIEEIAPQQEPFDPERHEAIAVREMPEVRPNTVIGVHQKGYLLNGRLLRPARVTVSRAP